MARFTLSLDDDVFELLKQESIKFQGNRSMVIKIALDQYFRDESEKAINEKVNQLELKFDQVNDKLILVESRLEGLSLQLGKLTQVT